ncbi:rhomboid-domain-containing protein [Neoconidiobolus thromboides FSU 785]|nr:rhomboid-domain-containing protein [Neoconidiobolus thromboides FSU 785]
MTSKDEQNNYYTAPANAPLPSHVKSARISQSPLINPESLTPNRIFKSNNTSYRPYFTYIVTLAQVAVFIYQLVNMYNLTGSVIQTQPFFNYLIGPSPEVLINQGARFIPCMKPDLETKAQFPCPTTSSSLTPSSCSLQDLCGISTFSNNIPDQWYRFITPIFLHGGVVHILLNLLSQMSISSNLEAKYGPFRLFFVYFASGIGGNLLGSNLALTKTSSVGASGAIFGLIACDLLDLLLYWDHVLSPWCELLKVVLCIIVSFALGLIPIVDNFAHIGGFVTGLLAGGTVMLSHRHPTSKRKVTWGFLIFMMVLSLILLIVFYYFTINGFYTQNWLQNCPNCKYLNCVPIAGLCDKFSV